MRTWRIVGLLSSMLVVAACSVSGGADVGPGDGSGADWAGDTRTVWLQDGRVASDSELLAFADVDAMYEFVAEPGGFLWPCTNGEDCLSGYCITTTKHGPVCTTYCEDECPLNWKCKSKQVGSDLIFLCVSPEDDLCRKCSTDDECGAPEDLCLDIGVEEPRYCGMACSKDQDCPTDYGCDLSSEGDGPPGQCVPVSGSCVCLGELDGTSRPCSLENDAGKCYGEETCQGELGWSGCTAPTPQPEECDGADNDCDGLADEGLEPTACEVTNEVGTCPGVSECAGAQGWKCSGPEAQVETCDGVDNDCDGGTDESFPEAGLPCDSPEDADKCPNGTWVCPPGAGAVVCQGDEPKEEICNGLDDDCDGQTDPAGSPGCKSFYIDADFDGFGFEPLTTCLCGEDGQPPYTAIVAGDCNDSNGKVNPLAAEVCNQVDDDCNGDVDDFGAEGCQNRYKDHDGDGFGVVGDIQCVCGAKGEYTAVEANDCDDDDPKIYPGADEYCNGKDDNCSNTTDEDGSLGCNTYYLDVDGDNYGVKGFTKCACKPVGVYKAENPGDCDDENKLIHPGQPEKCGNNWDDDCNGLVDEMPCVS